MNRFHPKGYKKPSFEKVKDPITITITETAYISPQSSNKASCQNCGAQFLSANSEGAQRHTKFNPGHIIKGESI